MHAAVNWLTAPLQAAQAGALGPGCGCGSGGGGKPSCGCGTGDSPSRGGACACKDSDCACASNDLADGSNNLVAVAPAAEGSASDCGTTPERSDDAAAEGAEPTLSGPAGDAARLKMALHERFRRRDAGPQGAPAPKMPGPLNWASAAAVGPLSGPVPALGADPSGHSFGTRLPGVQRFTYGTVSFAVPSAWYDSYSKALAVRKVGGDPVDTSDGVTGTENLLNFLMAQFADDCEDANILGASNSLSFVWTRYLDRIKCFEIPWEDPGENARYQVFYGDYGAPMTAFGLMLAMLEVYGGYAEDPSQTEGAGNEPQCAGLGDFVVRMVGQGTATGREGKKWLVWSVGGGHTTSECGQQWQDRMDCRGRAWDNYALQWNSTTNRIMFGRGPNSPSYFRPWWGFSSGTAARPACDKRGRSNYKTVYLHAMDVAGLAHAFDSIIAIARVALDYYRFGGGSADYLAKARRIARYGLSLLLTFDNLLVHEIGHKLATSLSHCDLGCCLDAAAANFTCKVTARLGLPVHPDFERYLGHDDYEGGYLAYTTDNALGSDIEQISAVAELHSDCVAQGTCYLRAEGSVLGDATYCIRDLSCTHTMVYTPTGAGTPIKSNTYLEGLKCD